MVGRFCCAIFFAGPPGVGKSTLAKACSELFSDAVLLNSEEVRKDLEILNLRSETQREVLHIALCSAVRAALVDCLTTVIVDANMSLTGARKRLFNSGRECGGPVILFWLQADPEDLVVRARRRREMEQGATPDAVGAEEMLEWTIRNTRQLSYEEQEELDAIVGYDSSWNIFRVRKAEERIENCVVELIENIKEIMGKNPQ